MFLARVISNGCAWQKQHIHNHCAIDRSIGVRWHGADQFLASRNIHGTFKQTWFALFVKTTLSLRYGGVGLYRPLTGAAWPRNPFGFFLKLVPPPNKNRLCCPCPPPLPLLSPPLPPPPSFSPPPAA